MLLCGIKWALYILSIPPQLILVWESHSENTQETGSDVYYMMKNSSAS